MIPKPIDKWLEKVEWKAVPPPPDPWFADELPYVTHEGVLEIGGVALKVMQLSNGQRIIDANDLAKFFRLYPINQPAFVPGGAGKAAASCEQQNRFVFGRTDLRDIREEQPVKIKIPADEYQALTSENRSLVLACEQALEDLQHAFDEEKERAAGPGYDLTAPPQEPKSMQMLRDVLANAKE